MPHFREFINFINSLDTTARYSVLKNVLRLQGPKPSAKNEQGEFERFSNFMRRLVADPHLEIKDKRTPKRSSALIPNSVLTVI
jgi:hypothetical protein